MPFLAPPLAGLAAALAAVLPPVAPYLLPAAAARLARAGREMKSPAAAFPLAAAVLPFATAFGLLGGGTGAIVAATCALAFVALPALGLVAGATENRRREELVWLSAALSGVGALGAILAVTLVEGVDPGTLLARKFDILRPELIEFYRDAGWTEETLAATGSAFDRMRDLVTWHLPGLVLAFCAIHAALLVYAFGRRAGLEEAPLVPGSFATFRTPLAAAAAFIPAGALAALADGLAARAAVTLLIPLGVLFFLRGMAIIRALLDRGRVGLLIRAPVYVLAVQMPIPVLVAIGGLLDEFLDFRGRIPRREDGKRAAAGREEGSKRNMSDVKVILTDEVRGLGNRGEVVSVAAGYARNFLLPKELAYLATPGNVKRLEQEKKRYDVSQAKEKDQAATVAKAFEGLTVTVRKKAGEHDTIYGSVTASELAEALAAKGITVDRRRIDLEEPIKRLGTHTVHVRLHREVVATLNVEVVAA
ncbi:MAG: 50S ribosomal protein L9 [Holophagales bacterium]|nr:50S ribosomal protein L9 [Holophagales bacterium]